MNKTEFTERCQAIGECESETDRREMIAQLITDAGNDYDDHAAAVAARDQALNDNEALREANMKLFKRIGDQKEPDVKQNPEPAEKRRFEDLFNDKGGIK